MDWMDIESAPRDGTPVLIHYKNKLGKGRTIKAMFAAKHCIEQHSDSDFYDYDEERDAYYMPEGWYECMDNWDDLAYVFVNEGEPTHWMPLPPPPTNKGD